MDKRDVLIYYAIKYEGNYNRIRKAIIDEEVAAKTNCTNCITIFDSEYPKEFLDLKCPPFVLFYKGNLELLKGEKIAIVGSRKPSDYALEATRLLALNKQDKVIVSGLAKGIDGQAHSYAKKTIAILGSGIDYIYPRENYKLYERIASEGLLLSEYPYKSIPYAYNFPFRNRLIAALASEVYIMEAHEKSGTLTTINEALELAREIKVLPFNLFQKEGAYNNRLIQDGALLINHQCLGIDKTYYFM